MDLEGRPPHWHTLVAVEHGGQVQGVMAVENLLRPSLLTPGGWVLYVDFIEVAPWNYRVPQDPSRPAVRGPRFSRAGKLLLAEGLRMAVGAAAGGRVGLHTLPQAAGFYEHMGMTRIGPDPDYYGLDYFEYADGVVARRLTELGYSA